MKWFKVKVELSAGQMQVWVDDQAQAIMSIAQLGRTPLAGSVAFRGFIPQNSPATYSAYFSNLKITKTTAKTEVSTPTKNVAAGQITTWRVSPAFDSAAGPIYELPNTIPSNSWTVPPMQSNGVFEFLRSRPIPKGSKHWSVVAETTLNATHAQTCAINMGFSDEITLLLNQQLLLYQDHSYRYAKPRQQGLLHSHQIVVFVPLNKGDNQLRAIVSDSFGGWGLSGRMQDCPGVTQQ